MEDLLGLTLAALVGVCGYILGQKLQPRNKIISGLNKQYEDVIEGLRGELKRANARTSWYKKGAVPSELASVSAIGPLADGIIQALPPNWRKIAHEWKPAIIKAMEDNPEILERIINHVKGVAGGPKGEEAIGAASDGV